MRSYPCVIVGLPYEGRAAYVERNVHEGDEIILKREPTNAHDPNAVACYHRGRSIGYIPSRKTWVCRSIDEGDTQEVFVTGFDTNDEGELTCVEIEINILSDGRPERPVAKSILTEIGDELRILAMLAAADGRIAAKERALIEKFAELRAVDVGLDPDEGEAAHAVRWARRKVPSDLDAVRIVGRLAVDRPGALQVLWDVCDLIAEVDGKMKDREREALANLRHLLRDGMQTASGRT